MNFYAKRLLLSVTLWVGGAAVFAGAVFVSPVSVVVEVEDERDEPLVLTRFNDDGSTETEPMTPTRNPWDATYFSFALEVVDEGVPLPEDNPIRITGRVFEDGESGDLSLIPEKSWKLRNGASQAVATDAGARLEYEGYIKNGRNIIQINGPEDGWTLRMDTPWGTRRVSSAIETAPDIVHYPSQKLLVIIPPANRVWYQAWVPRMSINSIGVQFADGSKPDVTHVALGTRLYPEHYYAGPHVSPEHDGVMTTDYAFHTTGSIVRMPQGIQFQTIFFAALVPLIVIPLAVNARPAYLFTKMAVAWTVERITERRLTAALVAAMAGFAVYTATIDHIIISDEGLYVSAPLRYAMGDIPYQDEVLNGLRNFDIVLWPLFAIKQDIPLLAIRLIGATATGLSMFVLYFLLRRFAPMFLIASAAAPMLYAIKGKHFTPGYNSIGAISLVIATVAWAYSATTERPLRRRIASVLGGVVFFVGAIAYAPLAGTLAVPVVIFCWAVIRHRKRTPLVESTGLYLITIAILAAVFFGLLVQAGLFDNWADGIRALSSKPNDPERDRSLSKIDQKLFGIAGEFVKFLPHAAIVLMLAAYVTWVVPVMNSGWRRWLALAAPVAAAIIVYLIVDAIPTAYVSDNHPHYVSLIMVSAVLGLAPMMLSFYRRSADRESPESREWPTIMAILMLVGFAHFAIQPIVSNNGMLNARWALGLLFPVAVVGWYRLLPDIDRFEGAKPIYRRATVQSLVAFCVAFTLFQCEHQLRDVEDDAWFQHQLLRGIRNPADRVEELDAVLAYLGDRVEAGETFLIDDRLMMLYYLTQTRPAINHTWTWGRTKWAIQDRAVKYMVENGRVPRYAIRTNPPADWDQMPHDEIWPIREFVSKNFKSVASFGEYQVMRNVDSQSSEQSMAESEESIRSIGHQ